MPGSPLPAPMLAELTYEGYETFKFHRFRSVSSICESSRNHSRLVLSGHIQVSASLSCNYSYNLSHTNIDVFEWKADDPWTNRPTRGLNWDASHRSITWECLLFIVPSEQRRHCATDAHTKTQSGSAHAHRYHRRWWRIGCTEKSTTLWWMSFARCQIWQKYLSSTAMFAGQSGYTSVPYFV
jgi:hypothetical protein